MEDDRRQYKSWSADVNVTIRGQEVGSRGEELERVLRSRHLYKTLSLLLARRVGVPILPTLLLVDDNPSALEKFGEAYGWPLMIRMDFSNLPKRKTLGGIPLRSLLIAQHVNRFLFDQKCVPLYHPHLDRFKDSHSCGVLLSHRSSEAQIEVVGQGFDASDLRLGNTTPHETIAADILDGCFRRTSQVSPQQYSQQRKERSDRIKSFIRYIDHANNYGELLPDLKRFDCVDEHTPRMAVRRLPKAYSPLEPAAIRELCDLSCRIHSTVMPALPKSEHCVASFSRVPRWGWVLWDVYGKWYNR
jgi:hypothetical protein